MNKIIMVLLAFFSSIILANLTTSSAHTKTHNNRLFFSGATNVVNFTITDHCIAQEQPFENKVTVIKKGKPHIDIRAGRHNNKHTAKCLISMFKKKRFTEEHFTFYQHPMQLNFAVKGTLSINGEYFDNIILAQGHSGLTNNWWFGGEACQYTNNTKASNAVNCTARDGKSWCFIRGYISSGLISSQSTHPDEVWVQTSRCINSSRDG